MIILAYAESVGHVVAGRIHADRALLQYDHPERLRPLLPWFEIEQQIASQSAPSFETYCITEAKDAAALDIAVRTPQKNLRRDKVYTDNKSQKKRREGGRKDDNL